MEAVIHQVLVPTEWCCNLRAAAPGPPVGHQEPMRGRPLRGEPGRKALIEATKGPRSHSDLAGSSASGSCGPANGEMLSIELNFCDPSRCILYRMKSHCTRLSLFPNNAGFLILIIIRVLASPSRLVSPGKASGNQ